MSGFAALHLAEPLASALGRLGYSSQDPHLSEVVPTAARGNNLVVATAPAALHAVPGLAGALSALDPRPAPGLLLLLLSDAALPEWEGVVGILAGHSNHRLHAVRSLARATRMLREGAVRVLLATPEAALALLQRSALKIDQVTAVFMAWPETWAEDAALAALMQDLGRDIQRIIYTAEPERVNDLVERYARRAHTVGPSTRPVSASPGSLEAHPARQARPVRIVSTPWSLRDSALKELMEVLDPSDCAVWTLTPEPRLTPDFPAGPPVSAGKIPAADLIVAYDLPNAAQLGQLMEAGQVVLLVPPTAQAWVRKVAPGAHPLRLRDSSEAVATEAAARRARIAETLEARSIEAGLLALAPLFERHDPAAVAAALYELWLERTPGTTPAATPSSDVMNAATARLWLGVGKKDGATANDFVGVLTKEVKLDRSRIGKIEVRELYSLVEVPANEAENLVTKMNGVTIRRRRVTARIDRGGKVRSER